MAKKEELTSDNVHKGVQLKAISNNNSTSAIEFLLDMGSEYYNPGLHQTLDEVFKQWCNGRDTKHDWLTNSENQLRHAAMALLNPDIHSRIDSLPFSWDQYSWHKLCIKPQQERLAIVASLCIAEFNRQLYKPNPRKNDDVI